jgi:predicted amidohydrolase YtcJ
VKLVLADHELPDPDRVAAWIRAAHDAGRAVAVHCVTRVALVVLLAAWEQVGAMDGDRLEHASVVPVELLGVLAELGVRVVSQPAFVRDHGDRYLATVDAEDVPHLYRCATLVDAGIRVAGSTDAPFGPEDPWVAVRAATDRCTRSGSVVGGGERLAPPRALELFLGSADDPGGPPRTVHVGAPADLCLLDAPLQEALSAPSSDRVVATWVAGEPVHARM